MKSIKSMKISRLVAALSAFVIGASVLAYANLNADAANLEKTFNFTGDVQTFTVPESGYYEIYALGAQGGDTSRYKGGLGGEISGTVYLKAGTVLYINVGGKANTFNGGGQGSAVNGGGASDIRINNNNIGSRILVAGGGGAASPIGNGWGGGATVELRATEKDGKPEDLTIAHKHIGSESAGGECYQIPVYHQHTGDAVNGGGCYTTAVSHEHLSDGTISTSVLVGEVYKLADGTAYYGDISTTKGGCYNTEVTKYHQHTGVSTTKGGCYTTPVYKQHVHTSSCYRTCTITYSYYILNNASMHCGGSTMPGHAYNCWTGYATHSVCGTKTVCAAHISTVTESGACPSGRTETHQALACGKTAGTRYESEGIDYYALGCGKDETTAIGTAYALDCGKDVGSADGYKMSCNKSETTIDSYKLSCNKTDDGGSYQGEAGTYGGGGGYYGGTKGSAVYHRHTGTSGTTSANGCYTNPYNSRECTSQCHWVDGYDFGPATSNCTIHSYHPCEHEKPGHVDGHTEHHDRTVRRYSLGCGKTERTIDSYKAAYGGSSYADSTLTYVAKNAAVNEGNGVVTIKKAKCFILDYNKPSEALSTDVFGNNSVGSVDCSGSVQTVVTKEVQKETVDGNGNKITVTGKEQVPTVVSYIAVDLPTPTLKNYTFVGWSTVKSIDNLVDTPEELVKVMAQNYGNPDSANQYNIPVDKLTYDKDGNMLLYAIWMPNKVVVQLQDDLNGSSELRTQIYGKTFNTLLDSEITSVEVDGKLTSAGLKNALLKYKTEVLPTPSRDGAVFKGWYTAKTGGTKITDTTKNTFNVHTTLYAQWDYNKYTVKFNANGGILNGASSKQVQFHQPYGTLPTASMAEKKFVGWCIEGDTSKLITAESIVEITSDITLYAQYSGLGEKVVFPYTGKIEYYTIPEDGYYKLQTYGAEGESNGGKSGGKGAYNEAVYFFKTGTKLAVNVGGSGSTTAYNGGGLKQIYSGCKYSPASTYAPAYSNGGGATGFWLNDTSQSNTILLSGGGGGATPYKEGGAGGTTNPGTSTYIQGQNGQAGGGGGYHGGTNGTLVLHQHTDANGINNGGTSGVGHGDCFSSSKHQDWEVVGHHSESYVIKECYWSTQTLGDWSPDTAGWTWVTICSCGAQSTRGPASGVAHAEYGTRQVDDYGWVTKDYYDRTCGKVAGQDADIDIQANGGSNYTKTGCYYHTEKAGTRSGNGLAILTPMYEWTLELNTPTTTVADVNATNKPSVITKDKLNKKPTQYSPLLMSNKKDLNGNDTYTLLFENGEKLGFIEGITELPQPILKGWSFVGWYTKPNYKTDGEITLVNNKKHSGNHWTIDTEFKVTTEMSMLGNKLYAHWDENEYFIRYYMNNTDKNIYNDVYTDNKAKLDTSIQRKGYQQYSVVGSAGDAYYQQRCLYDHNIPVLQNLYSKTGYYFTGWTNSIDSTNHTCSNDISQINAVGTGTGKRTGTLYNECETLKPDKDGETFKAGKGNFTFITDAKQHEDSVSIPKWKYSYTEKENGSNIVVLYATWEPIRYTIQYNGTENWNNQAAYKSQVYRYDQYLTLDANKFTRKAPHDITTDDGCIFTLKSGYSHVGWGFGTNDRKYNSSKSWDLLELNVKPDYDQGLLERDYKEQQTGIKNVLSRDSIDAITKYILDFGNTRTEDNIANKTEIKNKVIVQNLHSLWRRDTESNPPGPDDDPTDPTVRDKYGLKLRFDMNGGYFINKGKKIRQIVVMQQETFNEYFYEFNITGVQNKDLLGNTASFDSYSTYDSVSGINDKFYKIDRNEGEIPTEYRFLGWSVNPDAKQPDPLLLYPDTPNTLDQVNNNGYDAEHNTDGKKNTVNLDVYSKNKTKVMRIYNDTTLYAVWEAIPSVKVVAYRNLDSKADMSDVIQSYSPYRGYSSSRSSTTLFGTKNYLDITAQGGEKVSYMILTTGANKNKKAQLNVDFDTTITDMYKLPWVNSVDTLNRIGANDYDAKEAKLSTSNLNRNISSVNRPSLYNSKGYLEKNIKRTFYVPTYLGTKAFASKAGISNYKDDYINTISISQYSYFKKGMETATVELRLHLSEDNSKPLPPLPTPTPDPDNPDVPDPIIPTPTPSSGGTVLDDLKTNIKIRLR